MSDIRDLVEQSKTGAFVGEQGRKWLLSQLGAVVLQTDLPDDADQTLAAPEIQLAQRLFQRVEHSILEMLCGTSQRHKDDRFLLGIGDDALDEVLLRALRYGLGYPDDTARLMSAIFLREHEAQDVPSLCQSLTRKYQPHGTH